jgi:hypothetical protein
MKTMVLNRRSSFGHQCVQCGHELIAPEWTEYRKQTQRPYVHHVWHCWNCAFSFETIVDANSMEYVSTTDDAASLMVA